MVDTTGISAQEAKDWAAVGLAGMKGDPIARSLMVLLGECAKTAKRLEALEAAQSQPAMAVTDPIWTDTLAPVPSLLERLVDEGFGRTHGRAAVRVIAAWLREIGNNGSADDLVREINRAYPSEGDFDD